MESLVAARDLLANLWLAVIIWVRQDWAGDLAEVRDYVYKQASSTSWWI